MSCCVLWIQIRRKGESKSIPYWELKQKKSKQPEKQTEKSTKQSYGSIVLKKNALMLHSLFNHIISKLPEEVAKKIPHSLTRLSSDLEELLKPP